jgi:hypothetical protein
MASSFCGEEEVLYTDSAFERRLSASKSTVSMSKLSVRSGVSGSKSYNNLANAWQVGGFMLLYFQNVFLSFEFLLLTTFCYREWEL